MNKKEFLDALGKRLSQQLSQEKVAEHLQYYDRYLTEKMMQGMTEEEAVAQLGNPLLIARTIMDTAVEEEEPKVVYEENASGGYQRSSREEAGQQRPVHHGKISYQAGCLISAIVVILVLTLILKLVGSVLSLILPVAIPVLVVLMVIEYFKKR